VGHVRQHDVAGPQCTQQEVGRLMFVIHICMLCDLNRHDLCPGDKDRYSDGGFLLEKCVCGHVTHTEDTSR
jgi:hypothetical protein